jgi:cysteine desulfurase/selenocysteine lyase
MKSLSTYRNDFPMLKKRMRGHPLIYFDSAATSQKPQEVINSLIDYYTHNCASVHRSVYEIAASTTQAYEATRIKVQKLLNVRSPEEIIFTRGTTDAINIVAHSFGKKWISAGDEILISEMEHHSNIVPWQMICKEYGAILKVIPISDAAELRLDIYEDLLSEKTKLVAISHIANSTGTLNPIGTIISRAHHRGAKVLIDGAQSVPHLSVDVQQLDADFYVFSGHKCYGPTGVGILYGKRDLLEALPPCYGGSEMIDTVTFSETTYAKAPAKFEPGTPMIAEVIALGAAIDYMQKIGLSSIEAWEKKLLKYATEQIQEIPQVRIIGNAAQKGAILSFVVPDIHALDIGTLLDLKGIAIRTGHMCAQPTLRHFEVPSLCRVSFAFYNTLEEIDQFILALNDTLKILLP